MAETNLKERTKGYKREHYFPSLTLLRNRSHYRLSGMSSANQSGYQKIPIHTDIRQGSRTRPARHFLNQGAAIDTLLHAVDGDQFIHRVEGTSAFS